MNEDRIAGAAETLAGRAMAGTGRVIGNDRLIARGSAHRAAGRRRNIAGSIRDFFGLGRRAAPPPRRQSPTVDPTAHYGKDSMMNEDEIKGGLRYVKGKVEKGVGDVTTDTKWQVDGVIDQVAGGAQNLYGRAKDRVQDAIDDVPDALADAGERVRDIAHRGHAVASDRVQDSPVLLLVAAGVAGYALSWLLRGRRG